MNYSSADRPLTQDNNAAAKLFDAIRMRLVETGTRNRLIHVNRANARGNVVKVINELSDEV